MVAYFRIEDTDYMEGHDFEHFCADILRKNGFIDVQVTPGSGDSGADILAKKKDVTGYITYAIQCKRYQGNVPNKAVQEAHFAKSRYRCMIAVVLTNSYFTKQAQEDAQHTGVKLWDRTTLDALIQVAYPPELYKDEQGETDSPGVVEVPLITTAKIESQVFQEEKPTTTNGRLLIICGLITTIVLVAILFLFYDKNQPQPSTTNDSTNVEGFETAFETSRAIEEKLMDFLNTHSDVSISVLVLHSNGTLDISLCAEETMLQAAFPDYANALVVKSQELAAEYGLSISQISVVFTSGEDNMMTWRTTDCISGFALDTYCGADFWADNQTIADLVDRYGAMNWFYPLT